ncbi:MAG: hypothetical protein AAGB48_11325 [Planctomycetota bacterium]
MSFFLVDDVVADLGLREQHPGPDAGAGETARQPFPIHGVAVDAQDLGDLAGGQ